MTQPYTKPTSTRSTIKCFVAYILLVSLIIGIQVAKYIDQRDLWLAIGQGHNLTPVLHRHFEMFHSNLLWATVGFVLALVVMFMKVKK